MEDTGYLYAVICAAVQGMSMIVTGACLERLLTGRNEVVSRKKRSVIWIVCSFLLTGTKCLIPLQAAYVTAGTQIFLSVWFIIVLHYFYKDRGRVKLLHAAMLLLQNGLADIIQSTFWIKLDYAKWNFPFRHKAAAEMCIIVAILSIMLNSCYTMIVLRMRKNNHTKTNPVWLALMMVLILIFTEMESRQWDSAAGLWYLIYRCVFTVLEFAILMMYLSYSEKREIQEEKQRVQEEFNKLQQVMELEKLHYEQIEARREEMAKIRHDYNNVISSVMFLIENGRTDEAGDVIKDLSDRISKTREYPFCGVPIINAILTEKQKECETESISLTVDLLIPNNVIAADLDLCMIFGNLMDNAIRSCKELRVIGKECSIMLTGGIVQDYLIVKCRNTSLENREKKIKGTGYGHKILADIAGKYDGDFQIEYEDGVFTAQISLKNDAEEKMI